MRLLKSVLIFLLCISNLSGLELFSSRTRFPFSPSDIALLRENLLKRPDKLLRENTLFIDETPAFEIQDYASNHPFIGFLSECLSPICPLNRLKKPACRQEFDEQAAQLLYNLSALGTKRVTWASLASGELFEDLIIAAKALDKGVKQLDLHLIEPQYTLYKETAQTILKSNFLDNLTVKQALLTPFLRSLLLAAKNETPRFDITQEFTAARLLKNQALQNLFLTQKTNSSLTARKLEHQSELFKQFLDFFTYAYPQAKVRLFIYSSPEDYVSSTKSHMLDLIILTDPEQTDQAALYQEFMKLAQTDLKIGGKAITLTKPPEIRTYFKTIKPS